MTKTTKPIGNDLQASKVRCPKHGTAPVAYKTTQKRLFLRVTYAGTRAWLFICRVNGKQERTVLGYFPDMSFSQAKSGAESLGAVAASGRSPKQEIQQAREQGERDRQAATMVSTVLDEFDKRHLSTLGRPDTPRGRIDRWIRPVLGEQAIKDVGKPDFIRLVDQIQDTGVKQEHTKILKLCRQIWEFAQERGYIESNPVPRLKAATKSRSRYLSGQEISLLWNDADCLSDGRHCPFNHSHTLAWKLLVLTGQRINSLLQSKVKHFNLDTGVWVIPAELMKSQNDETGQAHTVHLSPLALNLVKEALRGLRGNDYLFTGVRSTTKPVSASWFTTKHSAWLQAMNIPHATVHDYRRALSTHGAELGIAPHIIEKILAHAMTGVMAVYNRAEYLHDRKRALEAYSDWIAGITAGSNVIPLHQSSAL